MRTITAIVSPIVLAAAAVFAPGCNAGSSGDSDRLVFTPADCGNPLLGCDFDDGVAAGAALDVRLGGELPLDGVVLMSLHPAVLTVTDIPDDGGVPTWALQAVAPGVATLSAVDPGGIELDTLRVTVRAPERLGLVNLVGDAVGPTVETGVDEAWAVNAGALVSFQAVPLSAGARLIGRLDHTFVLAAGSTLLDTEQSSSDRARGYLYVQPAAGDYPFSVELTGNPAVAVDVVVHAR